MLVVVILCTLFAPLCTHPLTFLLWMYTDRMNYHHTAYITHLHSFVNSLLTLVMLSWDSQSVGTTMTTYPNHSISRYIHSCPGRVSRMGLP
jgi:hypothetical protein